MIHAQGALFLEKLRSQLLTTGVESGLSLSLEGLKPESMEARKRLVNSLGSQGGHECHGGHSGKVTSSRPSDTHLFLNWFLAIILSVLFSHCALRSRTVHACVEGDMRGSGTLTLGGSGTERQERRVTRLRWQNGKRRHAPSRNHSSALQILAPHASFGCGSPRGLCESA